LQKYKYFQIIETLFTLITLLIIFQFINLALASLTNLILSWL